MHVGDIVGITGQWRVIEARGGTLDVTDELDESAALSARTGRVIGRVPEDLAVLIRPARPKNRDWIGCVVRRDAEMDEPTDLYRVRAVAYMGYDLPDQLWLHNEVDDYFVSWPEPQCHLVEWPENPREWF